MHKEQIKKLSEITKTEWDYNNTEYFTLVEETQMFDIEQILISKGYLSVETTQLAHHKGIVSIPFLYD